MQGGLLKAGNRLFSLPNYSTVHDLLLSMVVKEVSPKILHFIELF